VGGIFTETEAAVVSAVYSLILAIFVYRSINLRQMWDVFVTTALNSAVTIFCIGIAGIFGYLLAYYHVPTLVGDVLLSITFNQTGYLLIVMAIFLVVGTFMDATPAIIVLAPIVAPIAAQLGVNPIHLGVVVVVTLSLGLVTPPYGLCLLVAAQIARIPVNLRLMKTMGLFILLILFLIVLVIIFPDIALFVPRTFAPKLMGGL
jgi:tripartite ATP-independent transporter DctM subunit